MLLASAALGASSCASAAAPGPHLRSPVHQVPIEERDFHCARAIMDTSGPYRIPLDGGEADPALAAHLAVLPYKARRAALAAGLEPLLAQLLASRADAQAQPTVEGLALEQQLTLRLVAFHAQILAAAFEAGCTADMIQKLLPDFTHKEQRRQLTIAIASLAVAAVGSITAGAWTVHDINSRVPAMIGIISGSITGSLAIVALTHGQPSLLFATSRNRLVPIWNGSDPDHLYPPFVFHMLTYPDDTEGQSPRDRLLAAWKAQLDKSVPEPKRATAQERLLSDGGVYDEALLTLRAEMFESLESAIQGLARDLELLNLSLVHSLSSAPPAQPPGAVPSR